MVSFAGVFVVDGGFFCLFFCFLNKLAVECLVSSFLYG